MPECNSLIKASLPWLTSLIRKTILVDQHCVLLKSIGPISRQAPNFEIHAGPIWSVQQRTGEPWTVSIVPLSNAFKGTVHPKMKIYCHHLLTLTLMFSCPICGMQKYILQNFVNAYLFHTMIVNGHQGCRVELKNDIRNFL